VFCAAAETEVLGMVASLFQGYWSEHRSKHGAEDWGE